jgi:hypothetical protein
MLCLIKNHSTKTYVGVEIDLHTFLSTVLDGDEWSASRFARLTPRKRALVPILYGPQSRFVRGTKRKKSFQRPYREYNPGRPARTVFTILTELPRLLLFDRLR